MSVKLEISPAAMTAVAEVNCEVGSEVAAEPFLETSVVEQPHVADWFAFYLWITCFLLMMAMNLYDLACALINR